MNQRNISIDILKCIAAIMITNSHMELLYGEYSTLATGGAIGDALFFFCSGYTLFLKKMGRFDNWYKRRISRIYPTIFVWAILSSFIFNKKNEILDVIIHGGGWFVSCIMIYYAILYIINYFMSQNLKSTFCIITFVILCWYLTMDKPLEYNMYGATYFKWGFFFLFMLLGAIIGLTPHKWKYNFKFDFIKLTVSIILYFGILICCNKYTYIKDLQILSLIPLLSAVFYFYKTCNANFFKNYYEHKIIGWIIKCIGGLCLEIYLVQSEIFTDKYNSIFPFNIPFIFLIILLAAYILRCGSRIFLQIFKEENFNWKAILKI